MSRLIHSITRSAVIPASLRVALRELRHPGVGLVALFATLLFAITILALSISLTQSVRDGFRQSAQQAVGGDISLRLYHRSPSAEEITFLQSIGTLDLSVEQRVMLQPDGPNPGILTELKGVTPTYPLFGDVAITSGQSIHQAIAQQNGIAGAVVGTDLIEQGSYQIGDTIALGNTSFEIRDVIVQEPGRSLRLFSLGPRVIVPLDAYQASGLIAPGKQLYWYARLKLADPGEAQNAAAIARIEERFPDAGWRIVNATDGVPGIERIGDFASAFVGLMGIAIFAIAMTAIHNALRADLDARTKRFAMLRSIGARPSQLAGSIIWQLAVISAIALIISALLATGMTGLVAPHLADWLGVDVSIGFETWPLIACFVAGFIGLIAIGPIHQACQANPNSLLRHQRMDGSPQINAVVTNRWIHPQRFLKVGLAVLLMILAVRLINFGWFSVVLIGVLLICLLIFVGLGRVLRRLAGASGLTLNAPPSLRLALRNIARPSAPTVTVIASFGLATTCLVAVVMFGGLAGHHLRAVLPAQTPDLVFFDLPPDQQDAFATEVEGKQQVTSITQMPFIHGRATHLNGNALTLSDVPRRYHWFLRGDRGLSWASESTATMAKSPITDGEWWPTDSMNENLASLDRGVAAAIGIAVGDRLTINILGDAHDVEIANLRDIDWTRLGLDFPIILSPMSPAFPHGVISAITLDDSSAPSEMMGAIQTAFPDIPAINVQSVLGKLSVLLDAVVTGLLTLTTLATVGSVLVIVCGLIALRQKQVSDLAMLRALGIRPNQIRSTGALETGLMVGISGMVGVICGGLLAIVAGQAIGSVTTAQILSVAGPISAGALAAILIVGFGGGWALQVSALRAQVGWRG